MPGRSIYLVRETLVDPQPTSGGMDEPRILPPAAPDLDALLEMEDEIRDLSVQIHVATHRLLVVLAKFDRQRGWEVGGHRCCADWLAHRTGIDRGAARERVRAARALVKLPVIGEAMAKGDLSFSQVRALTRVATPDNQDELLSLAMENSSPVLERILRGWRRGNRSGEARRYEELHDSRCLSVFPDEEGMYVVKGVLPAELGLLLMRALDAASDALFREEGRTPASVDPEGSRAAAARRRADAMGLMAERALAAGFSAEGGAPVSGTRPERYQVVLHVESDTLRGEERAPGRAGQARVSGPAGRVGASSRAGHAGASMQAGHAGASRQAGHGGASGHPGQPGASRQIGSARSAGHVVPAVAVGGADHDGASGRAGRSGASGQAAHFADSSPQAPADEGTGISTPRSHLDDGTRVSTETSRRLCCDAAVVIVHETRDGEPLNISRKRRTIPPALRRALEVRDRGCRFPGCGCRFTDAHHVIHWADGGETSLANCLLLCRFHHRLLHEGGWRIQWWGKGRPVFVDRRGGARFDGGWKEPDGSRRP